MNINPINPNSHMINFRNGSLISGILIVVIEKRENIQTIPVAINLS